MKTKLFALHEKYHNIINENMLRVAGEYREDEMAVILDFLKKVTESAEEMSGNMEKAAS